MSADLLCCFPLFKRTALVSAQGVDAKPPDGKTSERLRAVSGKAGPLLLRGRVRRRQHTAVNRFREFKKKKNNDSEGDMKQNGKKRGTASHSNQVFFFSTEKAGRYPIAPALGKRSSPFHPTATDTSELSIHLSPRRFAFLMNCNKLLSIFLPLSFLRCPKVATRHRLHARKCILSHQRCSFVLCEGAG